MSYERIEELPPNVRRSFTPADQAKWMVGYNECLSKIEEGEACCIDEFNPFESASIGAWEGMKDADSSRFFSGQVMAQVIDLDGEVASVKDYIKYRRDLIADGGMGQATHSSAPAFTVWLEWEGYDDVAKAPAIFVKGNFFRDKDVYDREWFKFINGRNEFSMGSSAERTMECDEKSCFGVLRPKQWYEISNVERGANPRTGVIEVHIPEGEGNTDNMTFLNEKEGERTHEYRPVSIALKEYHPTECPIKTKYKAFKAEALALLPDADITYHEYGGIGIVGKGLCALSEVAKAYYGDELISRIDMLDDERERMNIFFRGYTSEDDNDNFFTLSHILRGLVGKSEDNDATKAGCPVGQHQHAGIAGCHDVSRDHHQEHRVNGSDKLDLTDEGNIDLNAITSMETPQLLQIVRTIAGVIKRYDDDQVNRFMSSSMGKEFVLMTLELKSRKRKESSGNMTKENVTPAEPDAIKFEQDVAVETSNILTLLAALNAKVDSVMTDIQNIKTQMAQGSGSQQSISDAVSEAVEGIDGTGTPAPGAGAGKGDEEAPKEESEGVGESEMEPPVGVADGATGTEGGGTDEGEPKGEPKEEPKEESDEGEPKGEPKEEAEEEPKDKPKGEDKEESENPFKEKVEPENKEDAKKESEEEPKDDEDEEPTKTEEKEALKSKETNAWLSRLDALKSEGVILSVKGTPGTMTADISLKSASADVVLVEMGTPPSSADIMGHAGGGSVSDLWGAIGNPSKFDKVFRSL